MASTLAQVVMLLVTGALVKGDDAEELKKMLREACYEESGVEMDLLLKMATGVDLEPDPKLKCYILCTMELTGMMAEGVVFPEVVIGLLPAHTRARNVIPVTGCDTQKGVDDCDTAFLTQRCWQSSNRPDYFFV